MKLMKQLFLMLVIILFTGSILSADTNTNSFYKGSIALGSSEYNDVTLVLKKFNMTTELWENAIEIRDDKKQTGYFRKLLKLVSKDIESTRLRLRQLEKELKWIDKNNSEHLYNQQSKVRATLKTAKVKEEIYYALMRKNKAQKKTEYLNKYMDMLKRDLGIYSLAMNQKIDSKQRIEKTC